MKNKKIMWTTLLFIALFLFLTGFSTGNVIYNIGAMILGIFVYKYGYNTLFREYDRKKKEKKEKADEFYDAIKEGKRKKKD